MDQAESINSQHSNNTNEVLENVLDYSNLNSTISTHPVIYEIINDLQPKSPCGTGDQNICLETFDQLQQLSHGGRALAEQIDQIVNPPLSDTQNLNPRVFSNIAHGGITLMQQTAQTVCNPIVMQNLQKGRLSSSEPKQYSLSLEPGSSVQMQVATQAQNLLSIENIQDSNENKIFKELESRVSGITDPHLKADFLGQALKQLFPDSDSFYCLAKYKQEYFENFEKTIKSALDFNRKSEFWTTTNSSARPSRGLSRKSSRTSCSSSRSISGSKRYRMSGRGRDGIGYFEEDYEEEN